MGVVQTYDVKDEDMQEFTHFFEEHQFMCPYCKKSFMPDIDRPVWAAFAKMIDGFAKRIYRIDRGVK